MKYRVPIAVKLITITIILLLAATVPIAFKSSEYFADASKMREETNNLKEAQARATEIENLLLSIVEKVKVVATILYRPFPTESARKNALDLNFKTDLSLVAVEVLNLDTTGKVKSLRRSVNEDYLKEMGFDKSYIDEIREKEDFPVKSVFAGNVEIKNSSEPGGVPLITMGVPFVKDDFGRITHVAIAEIRMDRIQKAFTIASERTSYLIDKQGRLLAHPNDQWAMNAYSMHLVPIVKDALTKTAINHQRPYRDPETEQNYIGAYYKTALGPTVITQVPEDYVLYPARSVKKEAFYITGISLSIGLFLVFLFSFSLTLPIEKLLEATKQIAQGNFDAKADVRSHDEVGELAHAFDSMTEGLRERDKIKNVMNKFHGAMAEELMSGELALGGSRKDVTVFFSDIRDFTKFSEGHTPEEVVDMLNEYFAIMVSIINRNNGVVDKFIGDAIMAVWGAVHKEDTDPFNCVKACLEMREALEELNAKRIERGKVPIKIGIGIHTGSAISGNIGSDERMEYTVIGDSVNMAARIEASTKAFGADLLISDATANIIKDRFILELAGKAEVKGKSEALSMFKVRGYIDEDGNEVIVKTEYSDFEAGDADKVKVAS